MILTNGCVNFHKFMDEVYEPYRNNFDVQISWDGNTTTRPFVNGDKTYESVYSNIIEELEKGRILVGRAVLNEDSVKCFYQTFDTYRMLNRSLVVILRLHINLHLKNLMLKICIIKQR